LVKVGVVIPARNEEAFIEKTLEHLANQTQKPDRIVVVDDGSTDKTAEIAKRHKASVISLPNSGYKAGRPELAQVINRGFRALSKTTKFDYVIVLGADHPLPPTYIEKMVARMEKDRKLVMASARILGEPSHAEVPNPSGRIYRLEFMREIGLFPINYGWEDYPLYKALMMGYHAKFFDDIISSQQRALRISGKKMYFWGKAMKTLGYHPLYVLGRCARWFFRNPKGAINMFSGYFSSDVRKYSDIGEFLRNWQRRIIWKRITELPRLLK